MMHSTIIQIGDTKFVHMPEEVFIGSGIGVDIEIHVKKGEITIVPAKKVVAVNAMAVASETLFALDWLRSEEEEAWKSYQLDK